MSGLVGGVQFASDGVSVEGVATLRRGEGDWGGCGWRCSAGSARSTTVGTEDVV